MKMPLEIWIILPCVLAKKEDVARKIRTFPSGFWFGVSTSAYQIEGAWKIDGKGPSIWDIATHKSPTAIMDSSTGDIAADSYKLYKTDVKSAAYLGVDFYSFSISWSRILPNGHMNKINQIGIKYYHSLMDNLMMNNIEPMVTMYHWDLPNELQKIGGWANTEIVELFVEYAIILFDNYADRVKYWITVNSPKEICVGGYGSSAKAPMVNASGIAEYLCAKNILLAHAKVYQLYQNRYRKTHHGLIGIAISFVWYEPASETEEDRQAAVDARMFDWGLFANPIFAKGGNFPREVKVRVARKSAEQGFVKSRLPEFTSEEVALIQGSADFLGVNAYTTKLAYREASFEGSYVVPSYMDDMGVILTKNVSWPQSADGGIQEAPEGFFELLMEIKMKYENPTVFITENGWATGGELVDDDRIHYMQSYLFALLDAVDEGADIRGYSVRSLIDGFAWLYGYTQKFGLYQVDFTSLKKARTPRKSAYVYKQICKTKMVDLDFHIRFQLKSFV